MKKLTFKKGIHPKDFKEATNRIPIQKLAAPARLYFALQQHIGAPLSPLVSVGDFVLKGQKIADSDAFMCAPLHSSVSGVVKEIAEYLHPSGNKMPMIVIENDGEDKKAEPICTKPLDELSHEEILSVIREAGIVGMGGAGFPTHVKLSPPKDKTVHTVIVNGAECEPYLTSDHRRMLETPELVLSGLSVVMKLFSLKEAFVAIEENKPDAILAMKEKAKEYPGVRILTMAKKYPQGAEKQMIYAVTGKEVPTGALPVDVGCIVLNVDTVVAIGRAVFQGKPSYQRVVTVAGDCVEKPGNFLVPVGTPFSAVIEAAGGLKEEPAKIIMGGPMMGIAGHSLDVPVVKGTSAILVLGEKQVPKISESPCIRCGRCAAVCPMNLLPMQLDAFARGSAWDDCREHHIQDCIECGSCSYICPAKRHLVQSIRVGKQTVLQALRAGKKS